MLTLAELSKKLGAVFHGKDMNMPPVTIDSRRVKPGEMFIALKGKHFDGHDFVKEAVEHGAVAIMVERPMGLNVPEIVVKETSIGLGQLATLWREQFKIPVIALTGSCGKTGTKEMISNILQEMGETLFTQGNLNNHFGLPLTLLRLRPPHQYAVLEMGTSHPGEIRYLVEMGKPTVSLITNIYPQHLEGFGHIDLIAKEKSEIFAGLSHDGVAIINADEPYAPEWQKKVEHRHWITFGLKNPADVHAKNISISPEGSRFDLFTPIGQQSIFIPLLGPHVVQNALAAAAASMSVGASLKAVAEGLSKVKPVKGRLAPHTLKNGAILIDDTYNAGAPSVENALKLLQQFPKPRLFVMSNMAELGPLAEHYHQSMGEWIVKYGVDQAFLYGDRALLAYTLKSAHGKAHYFETQEELVLALREKLTPSSTVLVKGSRGNKMENIVNELLEPITC